MRAWVAAHARCASTLTASVEAAAAEAAAGASVVAAMLQGPQWLIIRALNGDPAVAAVREAAADAGALAYVDALSHGASEAEAAEASAEAAALALAAAGAKGLAAEDPEIEAGAKILAEVAAKWPPSHGKGGATASSKGAAQHQAPAHAAAKDARGKGDGAPRVKGGTATSKGAVGGVDAAAGAIDDEGAAWAAVAVHIKVAARTAGASEEQEEEWVEFAKDEIEAAGGNLRVPAGRIGLSQAGSEALAMALTAAFAKGASMEAAEEAAEDAKTSVLDAGTRAFEAAADRGASLEEAWEAWAAAAARALDALAATTGAVRGRGAAAASGKGAAQREAPTHAAGKATRGKGGASGKGAPQ